MAKTKSSLPKGFQPVSNKMDGWFEIKAGNSVQGLLGDSFIVNGKFGAKRVYKIVVTAGDTDVTNGGEGVTSVGEGSVIGIDEKGYLKKLADIPKGAEVFIQCTGREAKAKKGQSPAWTFEVGLRSEEGI